jgi:nitrogen-specific signal transduction histidine kinase
MSKVVSQFSVTKQEGSLTQSEGERRHLAGANPAPLKELIHEVRQPLGVIECLAYYLELISVDEKVCARLQQIQAMVSEVNRILERANDGGADCRIESVSC